MRIFLILIIAMIIASFTAAQASNKKPDIINFQTKDNLQVTNEIGCVGIENLTNMHTPADIYSGTRKCIDEGNYKKAADMFAVAGVYGRFDQLRVADKTAHQAITVLQMKIFNSLGENQRNNFQEAVGTISDKNTGNLPRICRQVQMMGAPKYDPTYMIQHGMGTFTGNDKGIENNFNSAKALQSALDKYLHCPK